MNLNEKMQIVHDFENDLKKLREKVENMEFPSIKEFQDLEGRQASLEKELKNLQK